MLNAIDIEGFSEMLESTPKKPLFLDFYADWCGPCRVVFPILEEVSTEITDVDFIKVNVDDFPDLAAKFNIRNIPTFILLDTKDGTDKIVGSTNKAAIIEKVEKFLLKKED